jgi:hypothetical protein
MNFFVFKQNNWEFFFEIFICIINLTSFASFLETKFKILTFKKWKKTTITTSPSLHHRPPTKKKKKNLKTVEKFLNNQSLMKNKKKKKMEFLKKK